MAIFLMIQEEDNQRIELLKRDFKLRKKIDVIRAGLKLLEEAARSKKIERWKQAAKLVSENSAIINKEFQPMAIVMYSYWGKLR